MNWRKLALAGLLTLATKASSAAWLRTASEIVIFLPSVDAATPRSTVRGSAATRGVTTTGFAGASPKARDWVEMAPVAASRAKEGINNLEPVFIFALSICYRFLK